MCEEIQPQTSHDQVNNTQYTSELNQNVNDDLPNNLYNDDGRTNWDLFDVVNKAKAGIYYNEDVDEEEYVSSEQSVK